MLNSEATCRVIDLASVDTEATLVARVHRDPAAFAEVFDNHYETVARYVYRRTGHRQRTEDIVSETFMKALASIRKFRPRGAGLRGWLLRIASNEVNYRLRRDRVRKEARNSLILMARNREYQPHHTEEASTMGLLLRSLPLRFQEVLCLHLGCGLSIDETAHILECRPGTVKSRLARGRAALRVIALEVGLEEEHA